MESVVSKKDSARQLPFPFVNIAHDRLLNYLSNYSAWQCQAVGAVLTSLTQHPAPETPGSY